MNPVRELVLSMLGTGFRLETNDPRVVELVELFWEPFVVPSLTAEPVELSVHHAEGGWLITIDSVSEGTAIDPWVLVVVLRNLLTNRAIARASHIIPLHSSVVEREGLFLVLAGPSRAGKTTLMLELLQSGWSYVSDDLAPIESASARAFPFPKALQVRDPERWEAFSKTWTVPEWLPPPGDASLVPPAALVRTRAESYRPDLLVFSRYVPGGEPLHVPLTPAQAVLACGENLQRADAVGRGGLSRLTAWVAGATSARIEYGSSEKARELIGKCLAGLKAME